MSIHTYKNTLKHTSTYAHREKHKEIRTKTHKHLSIDLLKYILNLSSKLKIA